MDMLVEVAFEERLDTGADTIFLTISLSADTRQINIFLRNQVSLMRKPIRMNSGAAADRVELRDGEGGTTASLGSGQHGDHSVSKTSPYFARY